MWKMRLTKGSWKCVRLHNMRHTITRLIIYQLQRHEIKLPDIIPSVSRVALTAMVLQGQWEAAQAAVETAIATDGVASNLI